MKIEAILKGLHWIQIEAGFLYSGAMGESKYVKDANES